MIKIENENISALINPQGAELSSLRYKNREYLWQGSPDSWAGQSPQLFPVIGSCPEGGWDYRGRKLVMGNHGFARRSRFETVSRDERSCTLRLRDSEETRAQYPFSFSLDIRYTLGEDGLEVAYRVENGGDKTMLFSLGAHPGFNCPLAEGTTFEDYYLEFNRKETLDRRLKDAFLTGEREPLMKDQDRLPLDYDLFRDCAVIFSGMASDSVVLKSDKCDASVRMDFRGFPDFGIWTIQGTRAPYICLEPWYGVDTTVGDSPDFEKKEGLLRLEAGKSFDCAYSLSLS